MSTEPKMMPKSPDPPNHSHCGQNPCVNHTIERLSCMHEGVLVTNEKGEILSTTLATEHILESPLQAIAGSNIRSWFPTLRAYDELQAALEKEGRASNKPIIVQNATGKRKLVNMSIQRVEEEGAFRYVHVFQDCADLRSMEERLVQAERLAAVGRCASQIAHEVRNPLSSISLNVELLQDEIAKDNEEGKALIRSILRELERVNGIVSEYLQFSRFPKPHLKRGQVDSVIRDLEAGTKLPSNVQLFVKLVERAPAAWIDENLLRQVLDNLVRNAVEAIISDGRITIETEVTDRFFVIRVADTGEGIAPEIQAKLFEPFYTTKPHGTGLGLATSQQIIFEHNGHLLVESAPGKGATFTILLPL